MMSFGTLQAAIEQGVNVGAEQQPVVHPVLAMIGHGTDMRRLQHGNDFAAGHRATPTVRLLDECFEAT